MRGARARQSCARRRGQFPPVNIWELVRTARPQAQIALRTSPWARRFSHSNSQTLAPRLGHSTREMVFHRC